MKTYYQSKIINAMWYLKKEEENIVENLNQVHNQKDI